MVYDRGKGNVDEGSGGALSIRRATGRVLWLIPIGGAGMETDTHDISRARRRDNTIRFNTSGCDPNPNTVRAHERRYIAASS
jgi:hypothetical protein